MTKRNGRGSGWHGESRRHGLARKGVSTVLPDGRRLDVSRYVAGGEDALSRKGKKLLEKYGFYEEYVPFIWRDELGDVPDVPHYITVDFVLDSDLQKEYDDVPDEDKSEWLSSYFSYLVREGYIYDVYDDLHSPKVTGKNIRNKIDDMVLIYE